MAPKKVWQQIFFHPFLSLLFLDPGSGIRDPQHWFKYKQQLKLRKIAAEQLLPGRRYGLSGQAVRYTPFITLQITPACPPFPQAKLGRTPCLAGPLAICLLAKTVQIKTSGIYPTYLSYVFCNGCVPHPHGCLIAYMYFLFDISAKKCLRFSLVAIEIYRWVQKVYKTYNTIFWWKKILTFLLIFNAKKLGLNLDPDSDKSLNPYPIKLTQYLRQCFILRGIKSAG